MSKVDITPLSNAIERLEEALAVYHGDPSQTLIRDGLIQRFEFTYEIAHRTLKRYLVEVSPTPAQYDAMPFQDLIRSANTQGLLLGDWPKWRVYRDMRASSVLKFALVDARQGGNRRKSAVYAPVHEHFEPISNAASRRRSEFQHTARTSLTYDETTAIEVVEGIAPFVAEARYLREQLANRLK